MLKRFALVYFILFNVCEYTVAVFRHTRRASDPITNGCEPPCGCWELNSGPLEEQSVLLTADPSLQPRCPVLVERGVYLEGGLKFQKLLVISNELIASRW